MQRAFGSGGLRRAEIVFGVALTCIAVMGVANVDSLFGLRNQGVSTNAPVSETFLRLHPA